MKKSVILSVFFFLLCLAACSNSLERPIDLSDLSPKDCFVTEEGYVFPKLSWLDTKENVQTTLDLPELHFLDNETKIGQDWNDDGKVVRSEGSIPATLFGQNGTLTFSYFDEKLYIVRFDIEVQDATAVMDSLYSKLSPVLGEPKEIQKDTTNVPYYYIWQSEEQVNNSTFIYLWANNIDTPAESVETAKNVSLIWNCSFN